MENKIKGSTVLHIRMLGFFQVLRNQEILTWPTQKSKALFQILLVEPGRFVPTDQLVEYLWPDFPPRKAQNNLWVTISQLRRVLEPDLPPRARSSYIRKEGEGYRFNAESNYWLDCDEFTKHLAIAQSANDLTARITAWEAARILVRGEYLDDDPYAEWVQLPRIQWQRRCEQMYVNLAEAYGRNGRFQQAITLSREILMMDNVNETAYRLLMSCHAALGERAVALKVYDEAVQALQDEIGVDPLPETTELAHQIKSPEKDWRLETDLWVIPSVQSLSPPPFVGRGEDIDQFTRLLAQTAAGKGQMMLISGEPGIGKSRLIQETTVLARKEGFHLLTAHCFQVEQTIPYQPLMDLSRQVIARDDYWHTLAPVWLRELSVLVPEIGEVAAAATAVAPSSDELDENQQGRLFQAIFHLFANQADQQKLLLVVEDIHWADPATLQCLHYLVRHIPQISLSLVFTVRGESIFTNSDLDAMIHSLKRETHVTSLTLARFTSSYPYSNLCEKMGSWMTPPKQIGVRWLERIHH